MGSSTKDLADLPTFSENHFGLFNDFLIAVLVYKRKEGVIYANKLACTMTKQKSLADLTEIFENLKNNTFSDQNTPGPLEKALSGIVTSGLYHSELLHTTIELSCSLYGDDQVLVNFKVMPREEMGAFSEQFRVLFEDSPIPIQIFDRSGVLVCANKKWEEFWGVKRDNLIGWYSLHKDSNIHGLGVDDHLEKAFAGESGSMGDLELALPAHRDLKKWASTKYFPLKDEHGEVQRVVVFTEDITEKIQSREKLKSSEEKFKSLFKNAGHGIMLINQQGILVEINNRFASMLGYSKKELLANVSVQDITDSEDVAETLNRLERHQQGNLGRMVVEKRFLKKNGEPLWVRVSTSVYKDKNHHGKVIVGVVEDIHQAKLAIQDVKASERKFRSVFEETGYGVIIGDKHGTVLEFNKKARDVLGIKNADIDNRTRLDSFLLTDDQKKFRKSLEKLADKANSNFKLEVQMRSLKKDQIIWARCNANSYIEPTINELRVVFIFDDITKRKTALERIRVSENYQRRTIDALSNGLLVIDLQGLVIQSNKQWGEISRRFHEFQKVEVGNDFFHSISISGQEMFVNGLKTLADRNSSFFEMELRLGKREESWFAVRASLLSEQAEGIVITFQDITVRKRVEKALEESLSNYRNIYNLTPVMMHSIDENGRLMSVSNFWLEKLGYKRHEVIGKNLRDFLTEDSKKDSDVILPIFFEKGSIFDVTYHFVTKSGEVLETLLSAIEEGRGTGSARSLAVVSDITPLKRAERELKQNREELLDAQRIAKLGSYEIDFKSETLVTSSVFDEILEVNSGIQKNYSLFKEIVPSMNLSAIRKMIENWSPEDEHIEYVGKAVTLLTKKEIWLECLGRVVFEKGIPARLVGTIQDISKNKNAEMEIQRLSDRLTLAVEGANIGVWEKDLETGDVRYEKAMYELFGISEREKIDSWRKILEITEEEDRYVFRQMLLELEAKNELIDHVFRARIDGSTQHFRAMTRQIFDENGEVIKLVGVVMNITKDRELLNQLEESLAEKDVLIKEVHHRVKNNMQMISSILSLKSLDLKDQESKNIFDECTLRIKSMAVVHDQLYRFYNVSEIDISDYLEHLLSGLNALMSGSEKNYQINVSSDRFLMNVDMALLCGLIISEIVANAFKHGFKDTSDGQVNVVFKLHNDCKELTVTNSGEKIPSDILTRKTTSLGLSLIKTFGRQLGGELSIHEDNGLTLLF